LIVSLSLGRSQKGSGTDAEHDRPAVASANLRQLNLNSLDTYLRPFVTRFWQQQHELVAAISANKLGVLNAPPERHSNKFNEPTPSS
jgi:hypothetical protein